MKIETWLEVWYRNGKNLGPCLPDECVC